jgi:hypothetical protein
VESLSHGCKADIAAAHYEVGFENPPGDLADLLDAFLAKEQAFVSRVAKSKTKQIDVRAMVNDARIQDDFLLLDIVVTNQGTARPTEVVEAIFEKPLDALSPIRITRTRLQLAAPPQN